MCLDVHIKPFSELSAREEAVSYFQLPLTSQMEGITPAILVASDICVEEQPPLRHQGILHILPRYRDQLYIKAKLAEMNHVTNDCWLACD